MYATRFLSHCLRSPESLSLPPEGPNSGYLVLQDEESETTTCFGLCKDRYLSDLPFPQNKDLVIRYSSGSREHEHVSHYDIVLIPVLNQSLSSNRYYAMKPHRSHKGDAVYASRLHWLVQASGAITLDTKIKSRCSWIVNFNTYIVNQRGLPCIVMADHRALPKDLATRGREAYACSREVNMSTCCFCKCIEDVKPRPFDPNDIYQQFHIGPYEGACRTRGLFTATSIAPDGFPPYFMRRKGWEIYTSTPKNYKLGEALGVNNALRARLPDFNFPPHYRTSGAVVVGKWYCPFMFIRDGKLKDQMKRSMFYEMTLEQQWEQIFACENDSGQGNAVDVDATVQTEMAFIEGREASWDESNEANGGVWFRSFGGGGETSIGLSSLIIYRMRWEQQRAGWTSSGKGLVRVNRTEEFAGSGGWKKYGCYVLVERFVLNRMDGSLSLACDFKHTHVIRSKWE